MSLETTANVYLTYHYPHENLPAEEGEFERAMHAALLGEDPAHFMCAEALERYRRIKNHRPSRLTAVVDELKHTADHLCVHAAALPVHPEVIQHALEAQVTACTVYESPESSARDQYVARRVMLSMFRDIIREIARREVAKTNKKIIQERLIKFEKAARTLNIEKPDSSAYNDAKGELIEFQDFLTQDE